MAQIRSSSAELEAFFQTGDIPTSDNFSDVIKSFAVYDGSLPKISGSRTSTGSFGRLETTLLTASNASTTLSVGNTLIPNQQRTKNLGSPTR